MSRTRVLITGISSGIGEAIALALCRLNDENSLFEFEIIGLHINEPSENLPKEVLQIGCDVSDEFSLELCAPNFNFDIIINCAGVNYINWIEDTPGIVFDKIMNTNAKSIFLLAKKYYESLVERKGTILNIVSNASHTPMTNSIAYNASKGAAHIMTLQLARELGPKGITVFGISPNKIADTKMSNYIDSTVCELRGWTKEQAAEYQLKALPAGEETNKHTLAEFIAFLLSTKQRHKYLAGCVLPYGK